MVMMIQLVRTTYLFRLIDRICHKLTAIFHLEEFQVFFYYCSNGDAQLYLKIDVLLWQDMETSILKLGIRIL